MGKEATQFKPGQSGNPHGRPKGSKNKLSESFLQALAEDFEKHGKDAIEKLYLASTSEEWSAKYGAIAQNRAIEQVSNSEDAKH